MTDKNFSKCDELSQLPDLYGITYDDYLKYVDKVAYYLLNQQPDTFRTPAEAFDHFSELELEDQIRTVKEIIELYNLQDKKS